MSHQTSWKDFPFKPSPAPLPPQPYTLSQAFHKDTICSSWVPRATPSNPGRPVPATGDWDVEELHFFKLQYVNVRNVDFETYICPVQQLPASAAAIVAMNFSVSDYFAGAHLTLIDPCRIFGDNIVAVESFDYSEACVDKLVQHLLDSCNPSYATLMTVPQRKPFKIFLKHKHFNSTPDGSVVGRKTYAGDFTTTVIVIEDKKLGKDLGEYQIAGEITGAALHNYHRDGVAQTIFAIRMIKTRVTVYRADFSVEYLQGLSSGNEACENVTIFRALGSSGEFNKGVAIEFGEPCEVGLTAISSMMAFSAALIQEKNAHPDVTPQATQQRLELLQASREI